MSELIGPNPGILDGEALSRDDMLALDRLAAAAWPPKVQENLDGWALRYADGVSRRANSVAPWPLSDSPRPMEEMLFTAQTFYEEHGLPPRFQVSPAAAPDALDEILTANGYEIEAPVTMHIADATKIAADAAPDSHVSVHDNAPDGWWDTYIDGFDRDASSIVAKARDRAMFAAAIDPDGKIAAIGLGVLAAGWLGVFGMWTQPTMRGGGLGSAILHGLATKAVEAGAVGMYLQVENHNTGARKLYNRLGFRPVYAYYYRTLWS